MLHERAASSTHSLRECTDLEGLCCFEAAQVCMLSRCQMDSHGMDVMWHLPACHRQMGLSKLIDSAVAT